ncbi:cupin domain-containing protein [Sphingomonas sp. LHG3406-1]|uniref:cupin domain-containing protein n=1 Tax=Sphingomonas sp. LHG3406-1 TaxID=2804617 RepID=UPI0026280EA3|nr:cupin domain-containing protein [Sphingomonas sp. LHG3406-1]
MPKLDLETIEQTNATGYPEPHAAAVRGRWYRRLAPASGISDFGASQVTLEPGAWSSQRHWHAEEDELVVMLEGEAVLVEEDGRTLLRPGDIAAFPKGVANGHHLINEGDVPCRFVAIGRPAASDCHYPDIDMHLDGRTMKFVRKA